MREAAADLSAILDVEMDLRVKLCAGWGLSPVTSSKPLRRPRCRGIGEPGEHIRERGSGQLFYSTR
jgi:hypothetical protein